MNVPIANTDSLPAAVPGFEIDCEIAQGGMATVYLATQLSLGRQVALKVLRAFNDPEHKARFLNESRIIAALNHRNIITIYDVGRIGEQAFLSMEYHQGGDLAARIAQGSVDPCTALEIIADIGDCLAFVHEHDIIHRDVKPANILFHRDGTPILTDFGIAADVTADSNLTACGAAIGTPCYVSPEQVQGNPTDARCDIYSLGVVLYEMVIGQPPIREESAVETMAAHVSLPAPRLPDELGHLQPLLDRMLAKNPEQRFADAHDMVDAVRDLQLQQPNEYLGRPRLSVGHAVGRLASMLSRLWALLQHKFGRRRVVVGSLTLALCTLVWIGISALSGPDPVDEYLEKADQAFEKDRLAYPLEDSALFYFREVLVLDPENDDALDGLHDVAEVYADRAEADLVASNFPSAKFHIDRGLKAEPGNERLRLLEQDTSRLRRLPGKVVSGIKSIFD
jgi:tRNA A-37 threonylcarbamoyl transferase component Bud32